jgi:hypothetical protein
MIVRSGRVADLGAIYELIDEHVDLDVAPPSVMQFAMAINRNNIAVFDRHGEIVGFYAMLMLNARGIEAVLMGEFDGRNPSAEYLAPRLSRPAAIYQWLVVAPGRAAEGVMHVSAFLQHPFYRRANLYSRSITPTGERIATSLGFRKVPGAALEGLHRYVRLDNRCATEPPVEVPALLPQAA